MVYSLEGVGGVRRGLSSDRGRGIEPVTGQLPIQQTYSCELCTYLRTNVSKALKSGTDDVKQIDETSHKREKPYMQS